ncbi:MAG: porphobilinogen synthase [Micavibrio sp.]|nr:porphobilinogen synthase [Micavibrio sp.]|tara:strand:+ start:329 stop:1387 length:1059 start_codon:yes stop_codon:yes gene_type:complete
MSQKETRPLFTESSTGKCKGAFPATRMRRLRKNASIRAMVRENTLTKNDLIQPIFVEEETKERSPIGSLPGVFRESESSLASRVKDIQQAGINTIILFGVSHHKDAQGTDSLKMNGLFSRMIQKAKNAAPDIQVIADICLCEYTDHGHCGPLAHDGAPDNDKTLSIIAEQAIIAARSGADILAPSGMMDGMIGALRHSLDTSGYADIPLLSYAVKYASSHYGPFREAAGCSLGHDGNQVTMQSDRKAYQMDPANAREALREAALDLQEGADMLMVKPGLPYLDIIKAVKDEFQMPTFAYHVSGEYAMLKAAAEKGWLDYEATIMEQMMCFKRAGSDGIITYSAMDVAQLLDK